ncbi:MAG TPA: carboxysome shell carbonic anhydrase [Acidimicrobiales bacterium]|nr:carboxysome shell carbonic anhydrase [Acidimicrobiales bacterium]
MKSLLQPDGRWLAPWDQAPAWPTPGAVVTVASPPGRPARGDGAAFSRPAGGHPLDDPALSAALQQRAEEIAAAFALIQPVLSRLAPRQFDEAFPEQAHRELAQSLGVDIPAAELESSWSAPLALGRIHARCVLGTFRNLVEREFDRNLARLLDEGESAEVLIRRFGFHAVDITSCADGRLGGAVDFILRVPPAVVVWHDSSAGAMFDVEDALHRWEGVELRRWREGWPNDAGEPTRYLKIGLYHFSSVDPRHQGCAAHGSDEVRAATALLERLREFEGAVESTQCCEAAVATLLVGVDTDTDAIRVHVPDAGGATSVDRFVSSATLYEQTAGLQREAAKEFIRQAVADCTGVDAADAATEGMRWLCGYLLKNNIGQVDAVRRRNGGTYSDPGHTERLVVVGDAMDDVQLRNLAFQAQTRTLEEGAVDLDIGIGILRRTNGPQGLAVPVLVHVSYDERIPGARARAQVRARRLADAIEARYAGEAGPAGLVIQGVVRARGGSCLEMVEAEDDGGPRPAGAPLEEARR